MGRTPTVGGGGRLANMVDANTRAAIEALRHGTQHAAGRIRRWVHVHRTVARGNSARAVCGCLPEPHTPSPATRPAGMHCSNNDQRRRRHERGGRAQATHMMTEYVAHRTDRSSGVANTRPQPVSTHRRCATPRAQPHGSSRRPHAIVLHSVGVAPHTPACVCGVLAPPL